ncbi:MAG: hypothetical protein LBH96_02765 [Candidatus Peribacteria bacterium]|jgi:hypothetical protein|nr:hypothetical protein [Candidatus Peribacteria bacterium]
MKKILEDQKKNNLGLHSEQNMKECFQALGAYYQQETGESLSEQEQIAMWMYLT